MGGPRGGSLLTANNAPVMEAQDGGVTHRYVMTTKEWQRGGDSYAVYNGDGAIDPDRALPGAETLEVRDGRRRRTTPIDATAAVRASRNSSAFRYRGGRAPGRPLR